MSESAFRHPQRFPEWKSGAEPIRGFERVTCYRVDAKRGEGTEDNPHRVVTAWFTENGELIAYVDQWAEDYFAANRALDVLADELMESGSEIGEMIERRRAPRA